MAGELMAGELMAGEDIADDVDEAAADVAAEVLLEVGVVLDPQAASVTARAIPPTSVRARLINISAPVGRCAGKSGDGERAALWISVELS